MSKLSKQFTATLQPSPKIRVQKQSHHLRGTLPMLRERTNSRRTGSVIIASESMLERLVIRSQLSLRSQSDQRTEES